MSDQGVQEWLRATLKGVKLKLPPSLFALDDEAWITVVAVASELHVPSQKLQSLLLSRFPEQKEQWSRAMMLYESAEGMAGLNFSK